MTIARRTIQVIPDKFPFFSSANVVGYGPNHEQDMFELHILFAYRKTEGTDKRVRIIVLDRAIRDDLLSTVPRFELYYVPTKPRGNIDPVLANSGLLLHLSDNYRSSRSLHEFWRAEFETGNQVFHEGQTYEHKGESFDILSTKELDALSYSVFHFERDAYQALLKY